MVLCIASTNQRLLQELISVSVRVIFCRSNTIRASCAGYICYDDGCHLRKFARNPVRAEASTESKLIALQEIVVDKMHMKGHVDSWCKQNCDPTKHFYLDKVRVC